jgi:hypothetical protein
MQGDLKVLAQQLEEAPYTYIWEETTIDGKRVKVFKLGKEGKAKLDNSVSNDDFQRLERDFGKLRNFINYLSFDNEEVLDKLAKALLDNFPPRKSVRYCNIPYVHSCLDFNHTLTFHALERLVKKHLLVENRGWVKRVMNTEV